MKKISLVPFLLIVPLLSSCGLGMGQAPTFAKEGQEFDYEDFNDLLATASSESELNMYTVPLQDRDAKLNRYTFSNHSRKRNGKEIFKYEEISNSKIEYQFDYDSLVAKETFDYRRTIKNSDSTNLNNAELSQKGTEYYQFAKISGVFNFVEISSDNSTYHSIRQSNDKDDVFNVFAIETIDSYLREFYSYKPANVYDADGYLFYVNDETLFTFETSRDREEDLRINNVSYGKRVIKNKIKCQLDLTDKKEALRLSYEVNTQETYSKDYYSGLNESIFAGDIQTSEERIYIDFSSTTKKISVNEVDLSSYTLIR